MVQSLLPLLGCGMMMAACMLLMGRGSRRDESSDRATTDEGAFLAGKLATHTVLGALLGALGGAVQLGVSTRAFVIPDKGFQKYLPATGDTRVELGKLKPGRMRFTCAMGMYSGSIEAVA